MLLGKLNKKQLIKVHIFAIVLKKNKALHLEHISIVPSLVSNTGFNLIAFFYLELSKN